MRKRVGENVSCRFLELSAAGKVSASVRGIAPGAVLCPMPRTHPEFSVISICDRPPTSAERFLHDVGRMNLIDASAGKHVERTSHRFIGIEGIKNVLRIGVNTYRSDASRCAIFNRLC